MYNSAGKFSINIEALKPFIRKMRFSTRFPDHACQRCNTLLHRIICLYSALYQNLQPKSYQEEIVLDTPLVNAIAMVNDPKLKKAVHKYYTNSDNKDRIVKCDTLVRKAWNWWPYLKMFSLNCLIWTPVRISMIQLTNIMVMIITSTNWTPQLAKFESLDDLLGVSSVNT